MPFCRKCGRRLQPYSESCPDCGTSTTAPLINVKKASANRKFKAAAPTKIAKAVIPAPEITVSLKTVAPVKPAKAAAQTKTSSPAKAVTVKPVAEVKIVAKQAKTSPPVEALAVVEPPAQAKPAKPFEEPPKHEIKQSKLSIEEDILANPRDYETQTFDFDLKCPHEHFFPAGSTLPTSKGKAYCPICGEQLRKPERKKRPRYRRF